MPIPQEILAVKRPKNTIVIAYGKNKDRYAVRQRIGCRNDNGRHLPVNGPTIGHIVNGEYKEISSPREHMYGITWSGDISSDLSSLNNYSKLYENPKRQLRQ